MDVRGGAVEFGAATALRETLDDLHLRCITLKVASRPVTAVSLVPKPARIMLKDAQPSTCCVGGDRKVQASLTGDESTEVQIASWHLQTLAWCTTVSTIDTCSDIHIELFVIIWSLPDFCYKYIGSLAAEKDMLHLHRHIRIHP